ncbi:MAG: hypothetical protein AAF990_09625 [Bacteroidota bacterium]
MLRHAFYLLFLSLLTSQCRPAEEVAEKEDKVLAKVHNKNLYLSELEGLLGDDSSKEDSLLMINAFVERWVRESLLMHEAEKNISKDLNIDQLVRNYRASLVRHNYEKLLVELQLDSIIAPTELNEYYEANKDQYTLESSIARCYLMKVPSQTEGIRDLERWWSRSSNETNFRKILEFASVHAEVYMLEDSSWYKIDDLVKVFPKGKVSFNDVANKKEINFRDGDYQYLMKVFETIRKDKMAPLGYLKNEITRILLHKRKIKLLDDKKEEIYERETRLNNVKIYNF